MATTMTPSTHLKDEDDSINSQLDKSHASYDVEKALSDPLEGPIAVDPGVYAGEEAEANSASGMWADFDRYNRKLERKLGIETVSELQRQTQTCKGGEFD